MSIIAAMPFDLLTSIPWSVIRGGTVSEKSY